jgi:hypothetical protein
MSGAPLDRRLAWTPHPRPEWVARVNAEGEILGARSLVPLDEVSLLAQARANTGLEEFGEDGWREPFRILLDAIEREANLNLIGRLFTRSDLLIHLEGRLRVRDWCARHPEVEAERVDAPVIITGLARSGTTIFHETLAQDPQFRVVRMWEAKYPCPPPEPATYATDPRIERAERVTTLQDRITPEWKRMHKVGGDLPVECIEFMYSSFLSEAFPASFQVPTYSSWLAQADLRPAYAWHRRILQLLQSRHRAKHWLLKGPTHVPVLPLLVETYPDARIILLHRDPVKALASVVDVVGTLFWMRTDTPFAGDSFGAYLNAEPVARNLERVIGWLEDGTLARERVCHVRYRDFATKPAAAIESVYQRFGLELTGAAMDAMLGYLAHKPKGVFGAHAYDAGPSGAVATERARFRPYQEYFGIPDEI